MAPADFCWGDLDGISCISTIDQCYNEAIHWKHVYFHLPSGHTGNNFVLELFRLLRCFAEASALECVALKAVFLLPVRILLKLSLKPVKVKSIPSYIERRMALWRCGKFEQLMIEGRTIQTTLKSDCNHAQRVKQLNPGYTVNSLMQNGKVTQAIRTISNKSKGNLLNVSDIVEPSVSSSVPITVRDILSKKHPPARPLLLFKKKEKNYN